MGKPIIHARSSARRFGGVAEDYLDIHQFIDSSREAFSDLRHRALTHNTWFIAKVLPRVFGETRVNSDKKTYTVSEIGEWHVREDFRKKFIPTAQDFLQQIVWLGWMENGKEDRPPSAHVPREKKPRATKKKKSKKKKTKDVTALERFARVMRREGPLVKGGEVIDMPPPVFPRDFKRPCNAD